MREGNNRTCQLCTHGWDNFKNLTTEELEIVNEHRFEAGYLAGEIIMKQGSPCSNMIFLASGIGKAYIEGIDGKRIIIGFLRPGDMLVGPGLYGNNRHNYSLSAITNLRACFIDSAIIKEMVIKNGKFAEGLIKDISFKAENTFQQLLNLTQKKMHGRLSDGLLYLSNELFKSDNFKCMLTRQELGEFTNMTKESVVRILNEFDKEGILKVNGDQIQILDMEKLEHISISG
ncbi:Crp/Fnr family transcriptional regulator [Saccharicrinis sp. FJH54]|uniref:Crp/Fnr family transcriptional regulator n=1 Tax=Saccharicrinis sp. FJH54 TaxID=3344665 RepID=UPI0035D51A1D